MNVKIYSSNMSVNSEMYSALRNPGRYAPTAMDRRSTDSLGGPQHYTGSIGAAYHRSSGQDYLRDEAYMRHVTASR